MPAKRTLDGRAWCTRSVWASDQEAMGAKRGDASSDTALTNGRDARKGRAVLGDLRPDGAVLGRSQVDPELGEALVIVGVSLLDQDADKVLLARLAEGETIERSLAPEAEFALLVLAERERRDPALDLGVAGVGPPRPLRSSSRAIRRQDLTRRTTGRCLSGDQSVSTEDGSVMSATSI